MLKAGPRLLVLEGLHGSRLTAHPGTASVAFFLILVLGRHVVSKPVIPPKQKNRPGRYHVSPKSAKRSINFCKIPVKRKTLNVVDVFVPCLLVVVMFRVHMPRFFAAFSTISRSTLKHRSHGEQTTFPELVQNFCDCVRIHRYSRLLARANYHQRSRTAGDCACFLRSTGRKIKNSRRA